jgi:biotin-dependent carboxylase-like uncharacterized protein
VNSINVIDGGFFTTVQDLGRYGYQRYGVPASGAMDPFALRAANLLVGNPPSAAAFEITLQGPRLQFTADAVVAIAGADLDPRLDHQPIPTWRPAAVPEGSVLSFGSPRDGLRGYLAIAGGIDVPVVLGSRSTFTRGELGGFGGRPIRSGDRVAVCGDSPERVEARFFPAAQTPTYGHDHAVRVVLGPQDDAFTREGQATFLSATYVVATKSDRIGCRLEGPTVRHKLSADIVSDGIPFGAVQIAGDGLPIVLMADRGTTGGYTKIATVISVDLARLAQAFPGDRISFNAVSLDVAQRALEEQEAVLERVARSPVVPFARRRLHVRVDDAAYAVTFGLVEHASAPGPVSAIIADVHTVSNGDSVLVRLEVHESRARVADAAVQPGFP